MTENANPEFLYREFRDEDQDQVRRLFGHTHLSALDAVDPEKIPELRIALAGEMGSNLMDVRRHYASPPNRFIVICPRDNPDRVAAYCAVIHHSAEDAELKNVIVDPEYQGRRLGAMLMDAVDTWTETQGYRRIHLWTYAHLAVATTMYERRGYARTEHEFGDDVFTDLDPIYMERLLR